MPILPRLVDRITAISTEISTKCFADIEKRILKFIWKDTNPRIDKTILKQKNDVGGITSPIRGLTI